MRNRLLLWSSAQVDLRGLGHGAGVESDERVHVAYLLRCEASGKHVASSEADAQLRSLVQYMVSEVLAL